MAKENKERTRVMGEILLAVFNWRQTTGKAAKPKATRKPGPQNRRERNGTART